MIPGRQNTISVIVRNLIKMFQLEKPANKLVGMHARFKVRFGFFFKLTDFYFLSLHFFDVPKLTSQIQTVIFTD